MKIINNLFLASCLIMLLAMDLSEYGGFSSFLFFALFFAAILFVKYAYQFYTLRNQVILIFVSIIMSALFAYSFVKQRKPKSQLLTSRLEQLRIQEGAAPQATRVQSA